MERVKRFLGCVAPFAVAVMVVAMVVIGAVGYVYADTLGSSADMGVWYAD
jgi:uncharacterized membrane protein (DUF4010 family)